MKPDSDRPAHLAIVLAAIVTVVTACGPGVSDAPGEDPTSLTSDIGVLELECERSLQELDALIDLRQREAQFPGDRLIEARSIRDVAAELYVEGEFQLALSLIDEALALLGET